MPELEVFDNVKDLKGSVKRQPAASMEEALIRVLDLMDLYTSLDKPKPFPEKTDDGIDWVELKWPGNDQ